MDKIHIRKFIKIIGFSMAGLVLMIIVVFGAIGIYLLIADFLYNGGF